MDLIVYTLLFTGFFASFAVLGCAVYFGAQFVKKNGMPTANNWQSYLPYLVCAVVFAWISLKFFFAIKLLAFVGWYKGVYS